MKVTKHVFWLQKKKFCIDLQMPYLSDISIISVQMIDRSVPKSSKTLNIRTPKIIAKYNFSTVDPRFSFVQGKLLNKKPKVALTELYYYWFSIGGHYRIIIG